jgi:hypothetical protein
MARAIDSDAADGCPAIVQRGTNILVEVDVRSDLIGPSTQQHGTGCVDHLGRLDLLARCVQCREALGRRLLVFDKHGSGSPTNGRATDGNRATVCNDDSRWAFQSSIAVTTTSASELNAASARSLSP